MKWKLVSFKTYFLALFFTVISIIVSLIFQPSFSNIGDKGFYYFIFTIIPLIFAFITYISLYVGIVVEIIQKGERWLWILITIVSFFIPIFTLIYPIIYISAIKDRITEKSILEKTNVSINLSNVKDIESLDRPIKKVRKAEVKGSFCEECGLKVRKGTKYCSKCGNRL